MTRSFHYRDPFKTPVLQEVFKAIYRGPGDMRPGLTGLEIEQVTKAKGHPSIRPASDSSELRAWAADYRKDGAPIYYVPPAQYVGTTASGSRVSLFVAYRYNDPRAVEAREAERVKQETRLSRRAA